MIPLARLFGWKEVLGYILVIDVALIRGFHKWQNCSFRNSGLGSLQSQDAGTYLLMRYGRVTRAVIC